MSSYYGPNRVMKAARKGKYFKVEYESGEKEVITKELYSAGITEKKSDLTTLREKRMKPVVADILKIMLDYDIKPFEPMNEVDYLLSAIKLSYEMNFKKADEKKWGIPPDKLKFSDIDKALKNG